MLKMFIEGIGLPFPGAIGQGLILSTGHVDDQENSVPATVVFRMTAVVGAPEHTGCAVEQLICGTGLTITL